MTSAQTENDEGDLDTIAKAFGLVVIQWGSAEQSLDMLVALLWQCFPTRTFSKKIPKMLSPKLKFVRTSFNCIDSLAELRNNAERVLNEFDRLSSLRHNFIHGAVASLSPINGNFVLSKFDISDDFHHVREIYIPVAAYPRLTKDLAKLGGRVTKLVKDVFRLVKEQELEAKK
jgi:hypothetical protein